MHAARHIHADLPGGTTFFFLIVEFGIHFKRCRFSSAFRTNAQALKSSNR